MYEQLKSYKGSKIVVELVSGRKIAGAVAAVDKQNIRLETDEGACAIPISAIQVVWENPSHSLTEENMKDIAYKLREAEEQAAPPIPGQPGHHPGQPGCLVIPVIILVNLGNRVTRRLPVSPGRVPSRLPARPCIYPFVGAPPCRQTYGQPCRQAYTRPCYQTYTQPCYQTYQACYQPFYMQCAQPFTQSCATPFFTQCSTAFTSYCSTAFTQACYQPFLCRVTRRSRMRRQTLTHPQTQPGPVL